jgi:hypothetical protein
MTASIGPRSGWQNHLPASILPQRAILLGFILTIALIGFEIFNYSTTELALSDLLGGLKFAGLRWATILAIAFCSIDFAGIARLFVPEEDIRSTNEAWFLLGAWLLAASMNAVLTWWGVSLSLVNRTLQSSAFIAPQTLFEIVPVFVALLVWLTRILLIGSFSLTSQRLFVADAPSLRPTRQATRPQQERHERIHPVQPAYAAKPSSISRPLPRPAPRSSTPARPEPEYVPEPGYAAPRTAYRPISEKAAQAESFKHY